MALQSDRPVSIPDAEEGTLALIRTAAEETLAAWPGARAAVLFGSRARGDHSALSDWDIAFILSEGEQVEPIPSGLPMDRLSPDVDVQCLALPEPVARRKACAIGHVARGIARDGKLLAGIWDRSEPEGERVRMQPGEFWQLIYNAVSNMESAALEVEKIGKTTRWKPLDTACNIFAARSADAAEHLAKAMLGRADIEYDRVHDLSALARQAEKTKEHPDLARAILSMNGRTKEEHHVGPYGHVSAAGCQHAAARLLTMLPLLEAEIAAGKKDGSLSVTEDGDGIREEVASTAREREAGLRAAAGAAAVPAAPEEFIDDKIAVLVESCLPLADGLAALADTLLHPPAETPTPFD